MKWTLLFFSMMLSLAALGQDQTSTNDILVTQDGRYLQGQVIKVNSETVSFKYPGETVINEIKPGQLQKIVFSSGRVQNFDANGTSSSQTGQAMPLNAGQETIPATAQATSPNNEPAVKPEEIFLLPDYDQNSLAVVPLSFTLNNNYSQDLSSQSTTFVTDFLQKNAVKNEVEVMGLKPTIDKLISQNINHASLQNASLEDLQKSLGTRYALSAQISQQAATAPQKPALESFYAQNTEKEQKTPQTESGRKMVITLKVYDANLKAIAFEATLEQDLKGAYVENGAMKEEWKAPLEYLLNQFLMEEPL